MGPVALSAIIVLATITLVTSACAATTPQRLRFDAANARHTVRATRSQWRTRGQARISGARAAAYHGGKIQESWYEQPVDQFNFKKNKRYNQRYFICNKFFITGGPVFFYAGNEADVTLYINATGLIWENAEQFKALVVFAEHRYYGKSQPFGKDSWKENPEFLTTEQAMADFASLVYGIKSKMGIPDSPVIVFGGSYGGMLAAWLRMKYPLFFQGAIAASAPIGAFPGSSAFKPSRFWEIVTRDASPSAGADAACVDNVRAAFRALFSLSVDAIGRAQLFELLRLCDPLDSEADALAAAYWLQGAFDAFAMGNYPYETSYISGDPDHPLPAWPMRAACQHMAVKQAGPAQLLAGLRDAASLLYNASGSLRCFDLQATGPAAGNVGPWDYQFCTELDGQEQPYYPTNGVTDMFWDQGPFDLEAINKHCADAWGVTPRIFHGFVQFGGVEAAATASNIVFSNGLMDPWSVFGVLPTDTSSDGSPNTASASASPASAASAGGFQTVGSPIIAVTIPNGAHHVDLMFSNPGDTPDILAAREVELRAIRDWVGQYRARLHISAAESTD